MAILHTLSFEDLSTWQPLDSGGGNRESEGEQESQHGLALQDEKAEVKPPPMWRVMLMNDDYTPMEFVISVLQMFFSMNHESAYRVMMHVHTRGKGVCGVYSKEIAETKVAQVNHFAVSHQHPLKCAMEEV